MTVADALRAAVNTSDAPFIEILTAQRAWLVDKGFAQAAVAEVPRGRANKWMRAAAKHRSNKSLRSHVDKSFRSHVERMASARGEGGGEGGGAGAARPPKEYHPKRMAYIYNMLSWIQSSPNPITQEQRLERNVFNLTEIVPARPQVAGAKPPLTIEALMQTRLVGLSPASKFSLNVYRRRLYTLLVTGLLDKGDVEDFLEFTAKHVGDGPQVNNIKAGPGALLCTAKSIGQVLKATDGFLQAYTGNGSSKTFASNREGLLVEISGTQYAFRIHGTVEWENRQRYIYPAMSLHKTKKTGDGGFEQWHIKMHPLDTDRMFIDELYHQTERETQFIHHERLSAKKLFQFIAGMGYKTVVLQDASSIPFLMPAESGPVEFHDNLDADGVGFEYIRIMEEDDKPNPRYLVMTLVNAVKHVTVEVRETLRLYQAAAGAAAEAAAAEALLTDAYLTACDVQDYQVVTERDEQCAKLAANIIRDREVSEDESEDGGQAPRAAAPLFAIVRVETAAASPGHIPTVAMGTEAGSTLHAQLLAAGAEGSGADQAAAEAAAAAGHGADANGAELHTSFFRLKF